MWPTENITKAILKHSYSTLLDFSSIGFDTMNYVAFKLWTPLVLMVDANLLYSMHTSDRSG